MTNLPRIVRELKERIAELEAQLKAVLDDNSKLAQVRQAHNLEQQAKGVEGYVQHEQDVTEVICQTNIDFSQRYISKLRSQAKALKKDK